ncbi:Type-2 restriction enzyme DpnII [bacterium HR37]|nr:Type-2 restriction enzyme DpnII [bacterium HR37]
MVRFKELGFKNFVEYRDYFFNTLLPSNKTYKYFVDWSKVKKVINRYLDEISLLNSLTKVNTKEREKRLCKLLLTYPKVVKVIPLLIAERVQKGKVDIFDTRNEEFVTIEFNPAKISREDVNKIIEFCVKSSVINLFQEVKDLHDYLLGVEVGLDTNARKNRSGYIFEEMCKQKIKRIIGGRYTIKSNDPSFSLYEVITKGKSKGKTHDFIIYKDSDPLLIVECNFYNVSGSKPVSISESYIEMHREAKKRGVNFLWITDGPAWHKMKEPLLRSIKEMDWILNFRMLNLVEKILNQE